jgi:hypothetical protein
MFWGQQPHVRVGPKLWILEDPERDQGVVLRLDEQRRDTDLLQEVPGGLRLVIVQRSTETE